MHGYFIDARLYNRVRALANPTEYEDYRKQKIKEKLEEKSSSRITLTRVRENSQHALHFQKAKTRIVPTPEFLTFSAEITAGEQGICIWFD
jgi:hypothetical protein